MMWFAIAVASGSLSTIGHLLNRYVLKDKGDSLAFAFFYQAIAVILSLPLLFFGLKLPATIFPYLLLLIIGVVDTLAIFLNMESYKYLEVSLRTILYQTRIFWTVFFSFLILNEALSIKKIMGICLIFSGIALAVFQKRKFSWWQQLARRFLVKKEARIKGMFFTTLAAFLTSLEMIGVKSCLGKFSISFIVFFALAISSLTFIFLNSNLSQRTKALLSGSKKNFVWFRGILGTLTLYLGLWSVSLTELSRSQPILQSFDILTILAGIVIFKEKQRFWQKIAGGFLTGIGVFLIKGS